MKETVLTCDRCNPDLPIVERLAVETVAVRTLTHGDIKQALCEEHVAPVLTFLNGHAETNGTKGKARSSKRRGLRPSSPTTVEEARQTNKDRAYTTRFVICNLCDRAGRDRIICTVNNLTQHNRSVHDGVPRDYRELDQPAAPWEQNN